MAAAQMFIAVAATLLALHATLGASQSQDQCKDLLKPLVIDSQSPIYGKWVWSAGAWNKPGLKNAVSTVKSSWVELSPTADQGVITIRWADRLKQEDKEDLCLPGGSDMSVSGSSYQTTLNIMGQTSTHEGRYYETCADCLLNEDTTLLPNGEIKERYLLLFTRTGQLDAAELEKFKKQAECLKMYPEYHITGTGDLCPDEREAA